MFTKSAILVFLSLMIISIRAQQESTLSEYLSTITSFKQSTLVESGIETTNNPQSTVSEDSVRTDEDSTRSTSAPVTNSESMPSSTGEPVSNNTASNYEDQSAESRNMSQISEPPTTLESVSSEGTEYSSEESVTSTNVETTTTILSDWEKDPRFVCGKSNPCGFVVHGRLSTLPPIDGPCKCPEHQKCGRFLKNDDSQSTWWFGCEDKTTPVPQSTTELPRTANVLSSTNGEL